MGKTEKLCNVEYVLGFMVTGRERFNGGLSDKELILGVRGPELTLRQTSCSVQANTQERAGGNEL